MRLRPEAGAGIEKSGRGSRAQNQIQKFIFPPELSPNNWLPVQHFLYLGESSKTVEVRLRSHFGPRSASKRVSSGVVVEQFEDGGRLRNDSKSAKQFVETVNKTFNVKIVKRVAGQNIQHLTRVKYFKNEKNVG